VAGVAAHFNDDVVGDVLPRAQRDFARLFDDRAGAAFLASFTVATEEGRPDALRVPRSVDLARRIATSPLLTLSSAH
jgi:hypothetical protein